jgi:archaellum component FlaC
MPLSTQEWGDVRNEFAEWIEDNPEFQDDSPNSLFEVKNDRGERVFHVDTSPSDELGNDVAEGEFPHSQFGAGHVTNMKQAVKWLATLGVKPQDFTAAQWTRRNHSELEKVVELDAEDLEDRVDGLEVSVDGLQENVDSLESQLTRVDGMVDGISEGVQSNREWISDVEDRVDDAVNRVDASREEFHGFRSDVVEELQSVEQEIDSVEKWFSEEVRDTQDLVQERVGDVESEVGSLRETVEEGNRRQNQLLEAILREQRKTRRLQERTVLDKARDVVESVKEKAVSLFR